MLKKNSGGKIPSQSHPAIHHSLQFRIQFLEMVSELINGNKPGLGQMFLLVLPWGCPAPSN